MIKAVINDQTFSVKVEKDNIIVNDVQLFPDISSYGNGKSNIILNNASFNTEVVSFDKAQKTCIIKVNGKLITVEISDEYDELLKKLGIDIKASSKISDLKAPMPGLVLKVLVKEGDVVAKGDNLLVLEAMKMENIIKSPAELNVKTVKAIVGDKVEKNQVLIVFS